MIKCKEATNEQTLQTNPLRKTSPNRLVLPRITLVDPVKHHPMKYRTKNRHNNFKPSVFIFSNHYL